MIKAAIIGGSGYTGVELLRVLTRHPHMSCTTISSRQHKGKHVADVFPSVRGLVDLVFTEPDPAAAVRESDVIFTALPHKTAMEMIPSLLVDGRKVVDLSADFRFRKADVYEKWYQPHSAPGLLETAVYGLPELHRERVKTASLVGNPGCYPTSIILGLAPLLKHGLIKPDTIIADSKSGVSGAGRGLSLTTHYCEVNDGINAYKIGSHRHTPEIEQELSGLAGTEVTISFTPHLTPMTRGILSTVYASVTSDASTGELLDIYNRFYDSEPFVRIYPEGSFPRTSFVAGTNYADIGLKVDKRTNRVVIVSAIDNLVKGASGQAVQNMNIMCGIDEKAGLEIVPLYP